jgi:peroxiredoxin
MALAPGDTAPDFTLRDQQGDPVSLSGSDADCFASA